MVNTPKVATVLLLVSGGYLGVRAGLSASLVSPWMFPMILPRAILSEPVVGAVFVVSGVYLTLWIGAFGPAID